MLCEQTLNNAMKTATVAATKEKKKRFSMAAILSFSLLTVTFFSFIAPLPSLQPLSFQHSQLHCRRKLNNGRKFKIDEDMFWKDGEPFQIIGGDIHYFRVLPEYWEDRLLRAKALGLNTIQTYVPWNLHEPSPGKLNFLDIADIVAYLKLCQKLDLLVMLRPGPYICAEWDLGGFPAWLLAKEPALRLRSSDPAYLSLVDNWWGMLLPLVAPFLYGNGGPIIMVQIENEYGSYGNDKAYLHHLFTSARRYLGDDIILYTTDGGSREALEKGTIPADSVYAAVDFTTGDDPWPIFQLQREFNAPGKSPPLSTEFYTGWLSHWGEKFAKTDADFTASELQKILSRNVSVVLYMVHGGTNFGFYNGANTGADGSDYRPDITSYDYDAPIQESGDVDSAKFRALRRIIQRWSTAVLPPVPSDKTKAGYGNIKLEKTAFLFDLISTEDSLNVVESSNPIPMESFGQMYGFLLYTSKYASKGHASVLSIPKVHDRALVFLKCPSKGQGQRPTYAGVIERWSNKELHLPDINCTDNTGLFILVENMGRINYGQYLYDRKGILSSVYLDNHTVHNWKMLSIPFHNLGNGQMNSIIFQLPKIVHSRSQNMNHNGDVNAREPVFVTGSFTIDKATQVKDTFLSVDGWTKGLAFVNNFNLGRYWPQRGPQCNLYVPAPVLHPGENTVVLFELESPNSELLVSFVDQADFMCGRRSFSLHEI